jgi:hypothetical protein
VVWEALAATVTGRHSWRLALGAVLLGSDSMVLIGSNAAAGLSVPSDSQSAGVGVVAR